MTACVLVVEDERKIRDLLRDYLEHDGLNVITTGSGAEPSSSPATPPPA
jgi:DNA-binding response OmpR family regulator